MKKHLIAAAVAAAVAAPAMAQNVEIYGVLDIGFANNKLTADSQRPTGAAAADNTTLKSSKFGGLAGLSGNRLGFRGTEDLGAGLKANFVLETSPSTEGGFGTHRLANIGISGGMGSVTVGRQVTIGKATMDSFTAFGGGGSFQTGSTVHVASGMATADRLATTVTTLNNGTLGANEYRVGTGNIGAFSNRDSNVLTFASPSFSGFRVTAQVSRNDFDNSEREGKSDGSATAFQLAYAAGPLSMALAHTQGDVTTEEVRGTAGACVNDAGAVTTRAATARCVSATNLRGTQPTPETQSDVSLSQFGAKYTLGNVNLFLAYASNSDDVENGSELKTKGLDVGATVGLGATTLLVSMGQGKMDFDEGNGKADVDGYQLQAHQALSKRTTLYALYGSTKIESNTQAGGAEASEKITMIGMRHTF